MASSPSRPGARLLALVLALVSALPALAQAPSKAQAPSQARAQAQAPSTAPSAIPVSLTQASPMHWVLKSPTAQVDIVGTMHVGLPESSGLPADVLGAFDEAQALYAELSTADYARIPEAAVTLMRGALLPKGQSLEARLTAQDRDTLLKLFGEAQFKALAQFKPWVFNLALSQVIYGSFGYDATRGLDVQLYARAGSREIKGLDALEDQLAILDAGTLDEELASLEDSLARYRSGELEETFQALTSAYAVGDSEAVAALLEKSKEDEGPGPEGASYQAVFVERNKKWAKTLAAFLRSTGRTFVFAGAGHFVGPDSAIAFLAGEGLDLH